jgi:hypothetical protein
MFHTAAVGSDYLPRIVAVCCFVVGLVMLANSLLLKKDKIIEVLLKAEAKVLGVVAIMFVFIVLSPLIGFLVSSILTMVLILAYLRCRKWHYYLSMTLLAGFVYFTFKLLFNVKLP